MVDGIIHDSLPCSIALKDSCWSNSQKLIRLLLVNYVECTDVPILAITAFPSYIETWKGFIHYCTGQDTCSCFRDFVVRRYITKSTYSPRINARM